MKESTQKSKQEILSRVNYVIDKLSKTNIVTKSDLECSTVSFLKVMCEDSTEVLSGIKKGINKLYSESEKVIRLYNKKIQDSYVKLIDDGVVYFVKSGSEDITLKDMYTDVLNLNTSNNVGTFNDATLFDNVIDNYMVLYSLKNDMIGMARFKIEGVNYIHVFSINLYSDELKTLLLIGSEITDDSLMGLKSILCSDAFICNSCKTVHCKKIMNSDKQCVHRKFLNLLSSVCSNVKMLCNSDDVYNEVSESVMEGIMLRCNKRMVSGKEYTEPVVVYGQKDEVVVYVDDEYVSNIVRSV